MKLLSCVAAGRRTVCILLPEGDCLDFNRAAHRLLTKSPQPVYATIDDMLPDWESVLPVARECVSAFVSITPAGRHALATDRVIHRRSDIRVLAPVLSPPKIVAVGMNYPDHCREQQKDPPERPMLFAKYPTAVIGQGDVVRWSSRLTRQVDFEAELAVVIGKRARSLRADQSLGVVAGYTALNDISARDLQFTDRQWVRGKSLDTFCPMGPVLVTPDEIPDPGNLTIECLLNGTVMQRANTGQMIFDVPTLLAFITEGITLLPGDVVATGTPGGVGVFRRPPVFLNDGDETTVRIEQIGELHNTVTVDP